jgi:3-methyladenine DNA glycosylase AlkC
VLPARCMPALPQLGSRGMSLAASRPLLRRQAEHVSFARRLARTPPQNSIIAGLSKGSSADSGDVLATQ